MLGVTGPTGPVSFLVSVEACMYIYIYICIYIYMYIYMYVKACTVYGSVMICVSCMYLCFSRHFHFVDIDCFHVDKLQIPYQKKQGKQCLKYIFFRISFKKNQMQISSAF